jgi:acetyl-CoA acetyltransferase family protein
MVAWNTRNESVAVVGGLRTPFAKAGTTMRRIELADLCRQVMQQTLRRLGHDAFRIDEVFLGNVVMPAEAANPARVAAMRAGVPQSVPALTVQRNCASGMEAIAQGAAAIRHDGAHFVLAGGGESMSNIPLLLPLETLEPAARLLKARTLGRRLAALASLRPAHLRPRSGLLLGLTDPLCGLIMGGTAEVVASQFDISRQEQDTFAFRSHRLAARAVEDGRFEDRIAPVFAGDRYEAVTADNGVRSNQSVEALGSLRPMFDRRDGTVTVGNSCQVTDGAACLLLAGAEAAAAEGYPVLGHIRGYATAGLDPKRMGLGPVHAIDRLLRKAGLQLDDIDLFEINEAFAAQVLACVKAMSSARYCEQELGRSSPLGDLDEGKLNVNGGAIALGHPVGATGARIVLDLLLEMRRRHARYGIASLCVAGGLGAAMLLEAHDS